MPLCAPSGFQLARARSVLRAGGVTAYPTEAVWGLGCDPFNPAAVERLIALKGRAAAKGLILVAADFAQLAELLAPLTEEQYRRVFASWPGPVTWLLPPAPAAPVWLRGSHPTLAVRVSAHPTVQALCRAFGGPLVSTSANPSGLRPARDPFTVRRYFGARIDRVVPGGLGGRERPSEIRDLTGRVIRSG